MAIRAHAQENQVKAWECASLKLKSSPQRRFIFVCSLLGLFLGCNTVNMSRWNGDFGEHGFVCHAVIAVLMIGGNVALISPEEVGLLPRDPVTVGSTRQHGIGGFRRAPASQRHRKASPCCYALLRQTHEEVRRLLGECRSVFTNANVLLCRHDRALRLYIPYSLTPTLALPRRGGGDMLARALRRRTGVKVHNRIEKFQRVRLGALEGVTPNDRAKTTTVTNSLDFAKHLGIPCGWAAGEDDDTPAIEARLDHMPYALRERVHRDLAFLVDLTRHLLLNVLARDFDFDNMGSELRREVRRIGRHVDAGLASSAQARTTRVGPDDHHQSIALRLFGVGMNLAIHFEAMGRTGVNRKADAHTS